MRKSFVFLPFSAFILAGCVASAGQPYADLAQGKGGPLAMFNEADTNKDGLLTRAEFEARKARHFASIDLNNDGALTPEELREARQKRRAEHRECRHGPAQAHGHQRHKPRGPLAKMDTNGDQLISEAEAQGRLAKRFAELDGNGDGTLSKDEIRTMRGKHKGAGPGKRFARRDANGDGVLTLDEFGPPHGKDIFARLDANGDGAISLDEAKAMRKMRHHMRHHG